MMWLERSVSEAIAWSRSQITDPTQGWFHLCQSHCRQSYGVGAWSPSAIKAWHAIPDDKKHEGGKVTAAPRGSLLYFEGGQWGHVAIAIGRKTNTNCLSNDYVRSGKIDVAPRSFKGWGLGFVGWSTWTPFGSMRLESWDGVIPQYEAIVVAEKTGTPNMAAHRLATRLDDLGFYPGLPAAAGTQGYPKRAVKLWQGAHDQDQSGRYGPRLHKALFGVEV